MNKKYAGFVIVSLAVTLLLGTQAVLAIWPQQIGGPFVDLAHDAVVDAQGNTYLTGELSGTVSFGDTTLTAEGLSDIFVAKLSPQGDLVWAVSAGGASVDRGEAIVVDSVGRVYVTGIFSGQATFGGHLGAPLELPGRGCGLTSDDFPDFCATGDPFGDIFVAKLDIDGTWLWVRQAGGGGQRNAPDVVNAIDLVAGDPLNEPPIPDSVVIGGRSICPVYFAEDGTGHDSACDEPRVLLAKIDVTGNWGSALQTGQAEITDLDVDPDDNSILVSGRFGADTILQASSQNVTQVDLTYASATDAASYDIAFWYRYGTDRNHSSCLKEESRVKVMICSDSAGSCKTIHDEQGFDEEWRHRVRSIPESFAGSQIDVRWSLTAPANTSVDSVTCKYESELLIDDFKVVSDTGEAIVAQPFNGASLPPNWSRLGEATGGSSSSKFVSAPRSIELTSKNDKKSILRSAPVVLPAARQNSFLGKLIGTSWAWALEFPPDVDVDQVLAIGSGSLLTAGTVFADSNFDTDPGTELTPGAFAARLDVGSDTEPASWEWVQPQGETVTPDALAVDPSGTDFFYLAGTLGETHVIDGESFPGACPEEELPPCDGEITESFSEPTPFTGTERVSFTMTGECYVDAVSVTTRIDFDQPVDAPFGTKIDLMSPGDSPGSTQVTLHVSNPNTAQDVNTSFPVPTSPSGPGSLEDFVGRPVAGDWTLQATAGSGTLQHASLRIETRDPPPPPHCEPGENNGLIVRKLESSSGSTSWTARADTEGDRGVAGIGAALVGPPESARQKIFLAGQLDQATTFGDSTLDSRGATDAFVAQLDDSTQEWFNAAYIEYLVGQAITPPPDAELGDAVLALPDIFMEGGGTSTDHFLWVSTDPPMLYPLWPGRAELRWKVNLDASSEARTDSQFIDVKFPGVFCDEDASGPCRQAHMAGAPAEIDPAGNQVSFHRVHIGPTGAVHGERPGVERSEDAAADDLTTFNALEPGMSVLIYSEHASETDIHLHGAGFEVVQTFLFNDPSSGRFDDEQPCTIGEEITSPEHQQEDRPGYVLNERAFFDGSGPDGIYHRGSRNGHLFAVNRYKVGSAFGEPMAIAWYQESPRHPGHFWPGRAAVYDCGWPQEAPEIVIASQKGSDLQGSPLNDAVFLDKRIYDQPDPELPGFNPNDEHALFAPSQDGTGFNALFALRADFGGDFNDASEPYALLKYRRATGPDAGEWAFDIFRVRANDADFPGFEFPQAGQLPIDAGSSIAAPYPLRLFAACPQVSAAARPGICDANATTPGTCATEDSADVYFQDYKGGSWAKAEGKVTSRYYYPLQQGFYFADRDDSKVVGDCVPWMDELPVDQGGTDPGLPIDVVYNITWPNDAPVLAVGETLLEPKRGLPDIFNQLAVQIIYDESDPRFEDPDLSLAQIIDPLNPRSVHLEALPESQIATRDDGRIKRLVSRADGTEKLTFDLQQRLSFDATAKQLRFEGVFDAREAGDPLLLLNVMTDRERARIKKLVSDDPASCSSELCQAVDELFFLTRNPQQIDIDGVPGIDRPEEPDGALLIGLQDLLGQDTDGDGEGDADGVPEPLEAVGFKPALTAGFSSGTGFLTLAFNNDEALSPLPVSVKVIKIGCNALDTNSDGEGDAESPYVGVIKQVAAESVFDEQLTLRHVGDFGGYADRLDFRWWTHPAEGGTPPTYLPGGEGDPGAGGGWSQINAGKEQGAIDHTIAGADIQTLSDNWFFVQYTGLPACGNDTSYSFVAGDPAATLDDPRPKLGEGWIKRVIKGLNPFEARVKNFHSAPTETFSGMLIALGERYEGDIAFNPEADAINKVGLIEAYETVLRRGMALSIDSAPPVDYGPVNDALLLITSRLSDFYMLLGNEAFADASDPMIGFGTDSDIYGSLAPAIFTFQNQVPSLLEEELGLLRGRDDSAAGVAANPVYNRLFWNFTTGDGEVAYAQAYNISDQDQTRLGAPGTDGVIDEFDARIMYPMGHGDAWGHYLMAIKMYYRLLRHPSYSWLARAEAINVAGTALQVDFLDERKFAQAAVARARTGAQLVDLTYRQRYVDDPAGQWQGYRDGQPERAWGVSGWGRRAGQAAYFDWVVGNALLPEIDDDPTHQGIAKVDRSTVRELDEVRSHFADIQSRVDQADQGLNPVGLAKGVVPFDIDPSFLEVGSGIQGLTHFEQVYERALTALDNAVAVYDHANQLTELLRRTQDSTDDFSRNAKENERDFNNRLIEIFGYPYSGDIGAGKQYPAGYEGPDTVHFMWIDESELTGSRETPVQIINVQYQSLPGNIDFFGFDSSQLDCSDAVDPDESCSLQDPSDELLEVEMAVVDRTRSTAFPGLIKPPGITGTRRATGDIQDSLADVLVAINSQQQAIVAYDNLVADIRDQIEILQANYALTAERIDIFNTERATITTFNILMAGLDRAAATARSFAEHIKGSFDKAVACLPKNTIVGLSNGGDLLSGVRCGLTGISTALSKALTIGAVVADLAILGLEIAKEDVGLSTAIQIQVEEDSFEIKQQVKVLEALIREEPLLRLELNQRREVIEQSLARLLRVQAEGQRTLEEMVNFRRSAAADVQQRRYQDMAFRIFRNDALQKYHAAFDLAVRYVFLAAAAYDYETNLLGSDQNAGQTFLTDIVRERSLGQMIDGRPVSGSGLADVMARLAANFEVLKGQLGFNNPQLEVNRFSLREELFRQMPEDGTSAETAPEWRQLLGSMEVDDLWQVPEFRRFARPFAPESLGPQPGLVIPFGTTVTFGENFFGWPLGPGDSAYDSSNFATKIHSVGVWFDGYGDLPLSATPRVYLVPVGADVLRSPTADDFSTREWSVVDQKIPVPLPISSLDLGDPAWIPKFDSVVGGFTDIRKFSSFRAYELTEPLDPTEVAPDTRLIGRSVWNSKWLLIIPGGTLLADPSDGLETFIQGAWLDETQSVRDGAGVSDIKILFQTYGYSGN